MKLHTHGKNIFFCPMLAYMRGVGANTENMTMTQSLVSVVTCRKCEQRPLRPVIVRERSSGSAGTEVVGEVNMS